MNRIDSRILFFKFTANHHLNEQILIGFRYRTLIDKLAVTQYRNVIAHLEDLFQTM